MKGSIWRWRSLGATVLLATAALMSPAAMGQANRLSIEAFFSKPALTDVSLSPSGHKLAMLHRKPGETAALLVMDLANNGKPTRIAQFTDSDIVNVHWINNERLIFGLANAETARGWRAPVTGLFAVDADGRRILQLVRRDDTVLKSEFAAREAGIAPMVSGDVRLVQIPVALDGHINDDVLLAYKTSQGLLSPFWLNTRSRVQIPTNFGLGRLPTRLIADTKGRPRLAVLGQGERVDLMRRQESDGTWVPLLPLKTGDRVPEIVGLDGEGTIYAKNYIGEGQQAVLAKLRYVEESFELETLIKVAGFDFEGSVITDSVSGETAGVRVIHERESTVWVGEFMRNFQAEIDAQLPGMVNRIDCRRCGEADMTALVTSYSDRDPGHIRVFRAGAERPEDSWRDIGSLFPAIEPSHMAGVSFQRIKARDGRDLPVWVTRPAGRSGPLPTVVLVHGGPWIRGGYWAWQPLQQFLASRGYLVIEPEMRGSLGYGLAHYEAGFKQYGLAMQDDVADALIWARQAGLASERACIAGASYGGYSALMDLIKHPELYRCGVAQAAIADLSLYLEGSFWVQDDIPEVARTGNMTKMVADPKTDAEMIAANSPVKQAARIKAPVLLVYGEVDQRVPLAHGKRMRNALRDAGNPAEWVSYTKEAHGNWSTANVMDYVQHLEAFLAKHLPLQ